MDDQLFQLIRTTIDSGTCLAFLGAGASAGYTGTDGEEVPGLPVGGQLSRSLAASCDYQNGSPSDLPKVAEYFLYAKSGNRNLLVQEIQRHLLPCAPRPIHTALAQLPQIRIAITSNYDTLLEREVERYGRRLTRHVHQPKNPKTGHFEGPLEEHEFDGGRLVLHKMHGTFEEPESMVVTQSDYIRYLARLADPDLGIPDYFRKTWLPRRNLLFLGYSLNDWNFQVIWEGMLSNEAGSRTGPESYALVKEASPFDQAYWSRRNVIVIEEDLTDFAVRLAGCYDLEIPSLGIEE